LDNLKYDYTADSALQVSLSGVFYSVIRKALEDAANRQMHFQIRYQATEVVIGLLRQQDLDET
ncbi:MAG: hypothetical protein U9P00_03200, partial [Pseudomonadota bacterium]|nr:hypothetical protein [Pseudomonadota bacterium]